MVGVNEMRIFMRGQKESLENSAGQASTTSGQTDLCNYQKVSLRAIEEHSRQLGNGLAYSMYRIIAF